MADNIVAGGYTFRTKENAGVHTQGTVLCDATGTPIGATSAAVDVHIKSGGGTGGTAIADEAIFTLATTSFTPIGGIFNTTPDTLATGKGGAFAMTAARGQHVYLVDAAGVATPLPAALIGGRLDVNVGAVGNVATKSETPWRYAATAAGLVTTTGVTAKTAGGAGVKNFVSSAQISNSHQTIGASIEIRDGAGGAVMFRLWCQFAGGGASINFDPPLEGTANVLVEIAESAATATTGIHVNLQGYSASA